MSLSYFHSYFVPGEDCSGVIFALHMVQVMDHSRFSLLGCNFGGSGTDLARHADFCTTETGYKMMIHQHHWTWKTMVRVHRPNPLHPAEPHC